MDRLLIKGLVEKNLSTRGISQETGMSQTVVRYWLKKYGLKTQPKTKTKTKTFSCDFCGETEPDRFYHAKNRCKNCHNNRQIEYVKTLKRKSVEYKGGKCEKCGYCKNYAALDFHHTNPEEKDLNWKTSRHWSWKRLKIEIEKCQLLCKNCHAEAHYPDHDSESGAVW